MGERITLTVAVPPSPGINDYSHLGLNLWWGKEEKQAYVKHTLIADNGETKSAMLWEGAAARTKQIQLFKADLSATSIINILLQRWIALGFLAGTISGTPD